MSDASHPAPHRHKVSRRLLTFCVMTAPAFWLLQLVLGYSVWAYGCYPGDHPVVWQGSPSAHAVILVVDAVAILAAVASGFVSYSVWRSVRDEMEGGHRQLLSAGEGRTRFMAMWGILFSGCFLAAILFATIASIAVPPCD